VTANYVAGTSQSLQIIATPTIQLTGTVYVTIIDKNGVLQPSVTFTSNGNSSYTVGLLTSPSLKAGHYAGDFQVNLCYDAGCSSPVPGSPVSVAFDFTVTPAPTPPAYTLVPTVLTATFTAGSSIAAMSVTVTPATPFTGPVTITVSDPAHVLSTSSQVTANGKQSYTVTVIPSASLAPGHVTGSFSLNLCSDQACASPLNGSPVSVGYDFTVLAPPAALILSPGRASGAFTAGDPFPFLITMGATASVGLPDPLYVAVSDSSGTLLSKANLTSGASPYQFQLNLQASPALAAGHYTGSFQLNVCSDQACTAAVPGSPLVVPFDIQVSPAPANAGLTPLTPWPGVADWSTFQANAAHTAFVPVTLDPSVFATRWLWTTPNPATGQNSDGAPTHVSTLTVAGGQLYVDSGYVLYALREFDHSTVWQHDFSGVDAVPGFPAALNPPAVSGGTTFVATSGQYGTYMFGLDSATGTVLFKTPFGAQWEHYLAPTVDGGVVFEDGGGYGGMYAFDATAGTQKFYASLQQFDEWTPAVDASYAYAYIGGQTAGTPAQLNMVDRNSGSVVYSIPDTSYQWDGYSMFCAPVLGQPGSVIAVNVGNPHSNALTDFDTNAHSIRWQISGQYSGNPAYTTGIVYAVNSSPLRLEARSETDGALSWWWTPQLSAETNFVGDVLVTNNLVFVSTNLATYATDKTTHQVVWSVPHPGRLALSADGVLYIVSVNSSGATDGTILAINVKR
jgi:hypothetical protein